MQPIEKFNVWVNQDPGSERESKSILGIFIP